MVKGSQGKTCLCGHWAVSTSWGCLGNTILQTRGTTFQRRQEGGRSTVRRPICGMSVYSGMGVPEGLENVKSSAREAHTAPTKKDFSKRLISFPSCLLYVDNGRNWFLLGFGYFDFYENNTCLLQSNDITNHLSILGLFPVLLLLPGYDFLCLDLFRIWSLSSTE